MHFIYFFSPHHLNKIHLLFTSADGIPYLTHISLVSLQDLHHVKEKNIYKKFKQVAAVVAFCIALQYLHKFYFLHNPQHNLHISTYKLNIFPHIEKKNLNFSHVFFFCMFGFSFYPPFLSTGKFISFVGMKKKIASSPSDVYAFIACVWL